MAAVKQHPKKKSVITNNITHNHFQTVNLPTEQEIQTILAQLDGITVVLGQHAVSMTTPERRRQRKVRRGGDRYMISVATLGERYGLHIPGGSAAEMQNNMTLMARLEPLAARLRALSEIVNDTILRTRSNAWFGTTATYGMLSRMSQQIPTIRAELEPVSALFINKKPGTTPSTTTTTPPASAADATPVVAGPPPVTNVVHPVTNGASAPPTTIGS